MMGGGGGGGGGMSQAEFNRRMRKRDQQWQERMSEQNEQWEQRMEQQQDSLLPGRFVSKGAVSPTNKSKRQGAVLGEDDDKPRKRKLGGK